MPYNEKLAARIRKSLEHLDNVEERKMFRGLAFLVNGKLCINASGDDLMVRFDPAMHESVSKSRGFRPMIMKGKMLHGYAYISEERFKSQKDFGYWVDLCLRFNEDAKAKKGKL